MACLEMDYAQLFSTSQIYNDDYSLKFVKSTSAIDLDVFDGSASFSSDSNTSSTDSKRNSSNVPKPPPTPGLHPVQGSSSKKKIGYCYIPKETLLTWKRLFEEAHESDVRILTDQDIILAHSSILGVASPVLRSFLMQARSKGGVKCIKVPGFPADAVRAFICFLYSSCYEIGVMKKFALHLLVLSHAFSIPALKRFCSDLIQKDLLNVENVVDVLQLARECDAPRLSLFCIRFLIREFKFVAASEGWKIMKQANPALEQELLECLVEADSEKQERKKKMEEKKVYFQLYEAMEALVHICKDGCQTIGPRDKMLGDSQAPCKFSACKGIELLIRHFWSCKARVPGGCSHCKRMWQLLELHSRMCDEPHICKVPLCRCFKDKMQHQSKRDAVKWKQLASKVVAAKGTISTIPARRPVSS